MQSRYYDPIVKRFINADDVSLIGANGEFISYNLFAYCLNNPVNRTDDGGDLSLSNLAKIAIGVAVIVVGAAFIAPTGGAAGFVGAAMAGVKGAAISGGSGALFGAVTRAVSHRVSTGSWRGTVKEFLDGAIDGFANGFMSGGILFGTSISYGVLAQNAKGIQIGTTAKSQYGKVNLGYGNPNKHGNTLLSLQNNAGKSIFRIDVDTKDLLHMHYGLTSKAMKIHRPVDLIYRIIGGITGVKKENSKY